MFAGQTVVAISQIFILGIPPQLAATWFPSDQVSSACAIGVFGNQVSHQNLSHQKSCLFFALLARSCPGFCRSCECGFQSAPFRRLLQNWPGFVQHVLRSGNNHHRSADCHSYW